MARDSKGITQFHLPPTRTTVSIHQMAPPQPR